MRFESCLAVLFTSLFILAVGSNDGQNSRHVLGLNRLKGKRNSTGDANEKRSKRSFSDRDNDAVLYYFNAERSLVGASDMNYVDYDFALQASLDDWTSGCNYDVDVSLPGYAHAIKNPNIGDPGAKRMMRYAFNLSSAFYTVRSIYVTGAAVSVNHCQTLIINGKRYDYTSYLSVFGITTKTGLFNDTVQQYTLGPACTRCPSNVAWCYNNLCKDDCYYSISGCRQIPNGAQTTACATTPTSTSTTTRSRDFNNGRSVAPGIRDIRNAILHGFLLFTCHYFQ